MPHWRKELSERVREVQEKRAREAALEAAQATPPDKGEAAQPQLELLPQADVAPLNPLVAAALRRIERAHLPATQSVTYSTATAASTALAYSEENDVRYEAPKEVEIAEITTQIDFQEINDTVSSVAQPQPEKTHNLVVVPARVTNTEEQPTKPKPRRMIRDDPNDSALNYLDSVPTALRVEDPSRNHAPMFSRLVGAVVDLMIMALLCAPFAALVELTNGNWQDPHVEVTAAVVFSVMSFLYLTISTALTGRTLGMRLLSLRVVDARTGLIPTGKQSAGRALVYLATLLTLGLAALYALVDSDKRTAHDRITRTAVIAV